MRIRILHAAGVGDLPKGAVVDLDDRRAARLVHDGYAERVATPPAKKEK